MLDGRKRASYYQKSSLGKELTQELETNQVLAWFSCFRVPGRRSLWMDICGLFKPHQLQSPADSPGTEFTVEDVEQGVD